MTAPGNRDHRSTPTTPAATHPKRHALLQVAPPRRHARLLRLRRPRPADPRRPATAAPRRVSFRLRHGRRRDRHRRHRPRHPTLRFGLGGQLAQVRDGDGRIVDFELRLRFQLRELDRPRRRAATTTPTTPRGNLTGIPDALNLETTFTYEPTFNRLASFTDARGNGIDYAYDTRGNLTAITYEDGTRETFTYDAARQRPDRHQPPRPGDHLHLQRRRPGARPRTTGTTPGIDFVYTYDTAGNLTSATDPAGTTTMTYDAGDRPADADRLPRRPLVHVHLRRRRPPHLAAPTRTAASMRYAYDAIGRLDRMTDGARRPDRRLRLRRRRPAEPQDAGQRRLHDLRVRRRRARHPAWSTCRADGTVLSRFDYTYDASGRRTSMTTLDGTFTYGYDAARPARPASTHPDGRVVIYDYDAAGNRRQVIDDGVATAYTTNDLNQYTEVGDVDLRLRPRRQPDLEDRGRRDDDLHLRRREPPGRRGDADGHLGVPLRRPRQPRRRDAQRRGDDLRHRPDGPGQRRRRVRRQRAARRPLRPRLRPAVAHRRGRAAAFYTFQAIGHTSELTDAAGAVLNSYAYDPFGVSLGKTETVANPFEYVGEYGVMNEGNGLEFMRARYYRPRLVGSF